MIDNCVWIVRVRFARIKTNIDIGGNRIEYDSSDEKIKPSPLTDFFEALLKADFTATVQPDGGIRKLEGVENLLKDLREAGPMPAVTKSILTKESLMKTLSPLGNFLPSDGVAPGARWSRVS